MGRRRTAWLVNGTGRKRRPDGTQLPGFYVRWSEPRIGGEVKRSRAFPNIKSARDFVRRHNARLALHGTDTILPTAISDAEDAFIGAMAGRSPETTRQYMVSIHRFAEVVGNLELGSLAREHVDGFVAAAGCGEATLDKHLRHLSRFFRWCVAGRLMAEDVTKLVTSRPRRGITRKRPLLTMDRLGVLLEHITDDDRRLAVQLAATTGLDRGMIAALTPASVDLEHRQIRVVRAKTKHEVFPFLHDALVPAIRRKMHATDPAACLLQGVNRSSRHRSDWFREAARAAGIPDLLFRDLRSFAANWARQAIGDFGAQKLLGHSTPAVTAKHYHRLDPQAQTQISALPLPGTRAPRSKGKKRSA